MSPGQISLQELRVPIANIFTASSSIYATLHQRCTIGQSSQHIVTISIDYYGFNYDTGALNCFIVAIAIDFITKVFLSYVMTASVV
jgi:hypothetical protein